MLFLALPALATAPLAQSHIAPPRQASAVVQATATIRVIAGVRLTLDGSANADAPPPRDSTVGPTGAPIKVIEFQ